MEALTLGVVQRWAEESESTLRAATQESGFPAEWETQLEECPPTSLVSALQRWALLKHFYLVRSSKAAAAPGDPAAAAEAAAQLLRREPVYATLAGHRVAVTGRSYNALAELAAHQLRINELNVALVHIESLHRTTLIRYRGIFRRRRVRRRLQLISRIQRQLYSELLAHRRALYAHALTPHGGPATDVRDGHPAPWWAETSIEDDARLLVALVEVGPARYHQLGEAARSGNGGSGGSPFAEDFGFHSLLTWIEGKRHLRPAALYDQDVGQVLASIRAGSLASSDIDTEG